MSDLKIATTDHHGLRQTGLLRGRGMSIVEQSGGSRRIAGEESVRKIRRTEGQLMKRLLKGRKIGMNL